MPDSLTLRQDIEGKIQTIDALMDIGATAVATRDPITGIAIMGVWKVLILSYTLYFNVFPDESVEFMKKVKASVSDIGAELLSDQQFQQSLLITFDELMKTRIEKKRRVIQAIFIDGYISADKRQEMSLERFYSVVQAISLDALEHLKFIQMEILPIKSRMVYEKASATARGSSEEDLSWWIGKENERLSLTEVIQHWIYEEYDANSPKIKESSPDPEKSRKEWNKWMREISDKKDGVTRRFSEFEAELVSLGVFKVRGDGHQTLTQFGEELLKFIGSISKIDEPKY